MVIDYIWRYNVPYLKHILLSNVYSWIEHKMYNFYRGLSRYHTITTFTMPDFIFCGGHSLYTGGLMSTVGLGRRPIKGGAKPPANTRELDIINDNKGNSIV